MTKKKLENSLLILLYFQLIHLNFIKQLKPISIIILFPLDLVIVKHQVVVQTMIFIFQVSCF